MQQEKEYTVSELNNIVKLILENAFPYGVYVRGEIREYKLHTPSGHRYFVLRDEHSQIRCVMWRYNGLHLSFEPRDGDHVRVYADVSLFERDGQYQLYVKEIEKLGLGSRAEEFEKLKKKLLKEGLFAPEHKKPIPAFPERIGVITSPAGAAIRDIIQIIRRRAPWVKIILRPALVQGTGASESLIEALRDLNRYGELDLIILGRGGGSEEDLWVFNDERLAREIYNSKIPVVSAVGHETDFTIADFVADLRAPTPSAAAELTTPLKEDLASRIDSLLRRGRGIMLSRIALYSHRLKPLFSRLPLRRPYELLAPLEVKVSELFDRARKSLDTKMKTLKSNLDVLHAHLEGLSPRKVLSLGYSIVVDKKTKNLIASVNQLSAEQRVSIIFRDGEADGVIKEIKEKPIWEL